VGGGASVPVHAGETIGPGLLLRILADAGVSREALLERA
jgi:predicted RNA binding protein YcfA (HicA-like mRNA interferase family)